MGGGGGSIGSGWSSPKDMAQDVRDAEKKAQGEGFQTELSGFLADLLKDLNNRDVDLVSKRLEEITGALEGNLSDHINQVFGGSVAKHTFIDGLSDIDCLLVLDKKEISQNNPSAILNDLASMLSDKLKDKAEVSVGNMAVTVQYSDGQEIQLLPATREGERLKIPSSRGEDKWSTVNPKKFQDGLTKYNAACDGKLVPTIKLAKAIIGQLPDAQKLSGYHVESLAIDAFKNYSGPKTTDSMLPHFFEKAKQRVLQPMTDSTGQSVHVDGYLGSKDSTERKNASHILERLSKRIANATAAGSLARWKDIFGEGE